MGALNERYSLALSITMGNDSRVSLSACKDIKNDLTLFTYFNNDLQYKKKKKIPEYELDRYHNWCFANKICQKEQINFIKNVHPNISILDVQYDNDLYSGVVEGLEGEREGGSRCYKCYKLRIEKTASLADDKYEYFGTTLSVSPHKNANFINEIGKELEQKYNSKFLISDFKKNEGYKRSIVLSKEYNLYRQDYCGCKYSKRTD